MYKVLVVFLLLMISFDVDVDCAARIRRAEQSIGSSFFVTDEKSLNIKEGDI